MNVNDIRIGNFIDGEINSIMELVGIFRDREHFPVEYKINLFSHKHKMFSLLNFHLDKFKGIIITKDWLLRLEFVEVDGNVILPLNNNTDAILEFNPNSGQVRLVDSTGKYLTHDELIYIHQVQNLFFSLKNKELIFK